MAETSRKTNLGGKTVGGKIFIFALVLSVVTSPYHVIKITPFQQVQLLATGFAFDLSSFPAFNLVTRLLPHRVSTELVNNSVSSINGMLPLTGRSHLHFLDSTFQPEAANNLVIEILV